MVIEERRKFTSVEIRGWPAVWQSAEAGRGWDVLIGTSARNLLWNFVRIHHIYQYTVLSIVSDGIEPFVNQTSRLGIAAEGLDACDFASGRASSSCFGVASTEGRRNVRTDDDSLPGNAG